jgi:hypothetical protein
MRGGVVHASLVIIKSGKRIGLYILSDDPLHIPGLKHHSHAHVVKPTTHNHANALYDNVCLHDLHSQTPYYDSQLRSSTLDQ